MDERTELSAECKFGLITRGNTIGSALETLCSRLSRNVYGAQLFLDWRGVVGVELSKISTPKSISSDKSTLTIRVEKCEILEVQYKTNFILQQVRDALQDDSIQRIIIKSKR